VERIAFAESDHAFGNGASRLGAKDRSLDAFLFDEVRHQIAQRGAAVRHVATEFEA
jgi:hypothetical protein